jgi:hypothetical protein
MSGPLAPDKSSLVWEQLHGQAIHYWRVLTLHGDKWSTSETASFEGPICMVDIQTLPPGDSRAATDLQVEVECSETELRQGIAKLSWTVAKSPGSEQRVAITIVRDGFESGEFEMSGPLAPDQSSLVWEQLHGQAIHYWRVLTLHGDKWSASETASFEGPTCVADIQ